MKIEIEYGDDDNLAGIALLDKDSNNITWGDLSRNKQVKVINVLEQFTEMFYRFLKEE